jgi:tetratricopeptide (TPR) repeat protein
MCIGEFLKRNKSQVNSQASYTQRKVELRAADYYASIRKPKSEWSSLADIEPQLAEFEHRIRAEDYESAYQLLELIDANYLSLWGCYNRVTELRENLLGCLTNPGLEMNNLGYLGRAYHNLGQFERAVKRYEQALDIARMLNERRYEGLWSGYLGDAYHFLGQLDLSMVFHKQALAVASELGDLKNKGYWLGQLGLTHNGLGAFEKAIEFYEQALAISRQTGDYQDEGRWLGYLGRTCRNIGQVTQAKELHEHALIIARRINDRQREEIHLGGLADIHCDLGQVERAIELYEQALGIARTIDDRRGVSYQLLELGRALLCAKSFSDAQKCFTEVWSLNMPETGYRAGLMLGIVALYQHCVALDWFGEAEVRCRDILSNTPGLYKPSFALATILLGQVIRSPDWLGTEEKQAELLTPVLMEYHRALDITTAPGVVRDVLRDLELIRAAGIEGLEPVFELLEGVLNEHR